MCIILVCSAENIAAMSDSVAEDPELSICRRSHSFGPLGQFA